MAEEPTPGAKLASDGPPKTAAMQSQQGRRGGSSKFAFTCAILASMTSSLLGYDIGVMSGATIFIQQDLGISDVQVEILTGILNLYSLIGSCIAARISDMIGRRLTVLVAAIILFTGAIVMGISVNYPMLMVGRFISGIGVGYGAMVAPVYIAEMSPASMRGRFASFPEVSVNVGILLGYVSNYALAGLPLRLGWRLMLGVGALPCIALALIVLAMPESPRWLVMQGKLSAAKAILDKTCITPEEAAESLADIKAAAGIPADVTADVVPFARSSHGEGVWKELFLRPTPPVRRILLTAVAIHFFQQGTGSDSVVVYSPRIFKKAGIENKNTLLAATVGVGVTKTCFILVATFLLDRVGRRPLLLTSAGGMAATLASLGLGLTIIGQRPGDTVQWAVGLSVASVMVYIAFFSIGLGPIALVYASEIFPLRLRAQGAAVWVAVNRVTSSLVSMTFLSLYEAITIGGAFFLYCGITALAWVFFFTCLPETRGKTLEETIKLFGITNEGEEKAEIGMA